ncbi:hypothetical protein CDAR_117091 [Caerostris darwini]|uniref:Odorant receptor n=1 Tax=Caerostris darwini TaxID=1538125 RepID=A0AAV4WAY2_9ARAC|nr:hypothetical protein CDAR_117091 [Caerostris darwini]
MTASGSLVYEISSRIWDKAYEVMGAKESITFTQQHFLSLTSKELTMTVWKITPVNRSFILAMLGTVVTYCILLDGLGNAAFLLMTASGSLVYEISLSIWDKAYKVIDAKDGITFSQQHFLCLTSKELTMTVWKITPVNRSFILAMLGTVVTYCILLDGLGNAAFLLMTASGSLVYEISLSIWDKAYKVIDAKDGITFSQQHFLCLTSKELTMTVWKITPVNRSFILAMLGTVVTYCILLDGLGNAAFLLMTASGSLVYEISLSIWDKAYKVIDAKDGITFSQQHFLCLTSKELTMTVWKITPVNRSFILAMLGTVVTYCILLDGLGNAAFLLMTASGSLVYEISLSIWDKAYKVIDAKDGITFSQQHFLCLTSKELTMTVWKITPVNRSFILAMLGTVVTYCILLDGLGNAAFLLMTASGSLVYEISLSIWDKAYKVIDAKDGITFSQQHFLCLTSKELTMTVWKITPVNRSFILAMLGTVVTYCILLDGLGK